MDGANDNNNNNSNNSLMGLQNAFFFFLGLFAQVSREVAWPGAIGCVGHARR